MIGNGASAVLFMLGKPKDTHHSSPVRYWPQWEPISVPTFQFSNQSILSMNDCISGHSGNPGWSTQLQQTTWRILCMGCWLVYILALYGWTDQNDNARTRSCSAMVMNCVQQLNDVHVDAALFSAFIRHLHCAIIHWFITYEYVELPLCLPHICIKMA